MNWTLSALLAAIGIAPIALITSVAQRHYNIQPDVTAALWLTTVGFGICGWLVTNGRGSELVAISGMWGVILAFSITIGVAANIFLFQSIAAAPNPGLALGIFNANALFAFLFAPVLATLLPRFFPNWEFSWQQGGGVVLVIIGLGLISVK